MTHVPRRILIVQLGDIGDVITSTPALAALREAHPHAYITAWVTSHAAPILRDSGLVNELLLFEREGFNNSTALFRGANLRRLLAVRRARYDTVLFFHHFTLRLGMLKFALIALWSGATIRVGLENGRGWFLTHRLTDDGFGARHQSQYWLDLVALLGADASPRAAQIPRAPYPLPDTPYAKRIVIHAGSGGYSLARRWNPQAFAQVADALAAEYDAQIVLVGGRNDNADQVAATMQTPALNLQGATTLPELADVLHHADLYIGADSGVMHLATACGVPVVALFGPTNEDAWGPWPPQGRVAVVRSRPICAPCAYVGHEVGLHNGCEARTCMKMIAPRDVLNAARALLDDHAPSHAMPRAPHHHDKRIQILGLPVDVITYEEWLERIAAWVKGDTPRQVCTINPEFIMIAQRDVHFRHVLQRVDLCVPDGVGLQIAARLLGKSLPQRVTGSDGVPRIAERAAREGWRLYLLGAAEGVAEKAAEVLRARYDGLQIVGTYSGSPAANEEDAIVARINAATPHILLVAYGAPHQDKWIARNLPRLNVKMAMGVGGTFDFIAGIVPRAPLWMRKRGLEWLYRLYLEPHRIGRMSRLPRFVWAVLRRRERGTWLGAARPDRHLKRYT